MAWSTPIPTVMAAIVMVIISSGIRIIPMPPSTIPAAKKLGKIAIIEILIERKSSKNISMIPIKTAPSVSI